jgi:hypothetical protein
LQLVNEDYRWWWRSFLHAGSCAFYTGLYAVWYHLTELEMVGLAPVLLYYGYMSIICFTFFLVTGKSLHLCKVSAIEQSSRSSTAAVGGTLLTAVDYIAVDVLVFANMSH